jgi:ribosomal protein S18 acetylase RimI-like enzyme
MTTAPSPVLRPATLDDVATTLAWSPTHEALRRWAGSTVRWPATVETLWADINNADATTFAFESPVHGMVGFGQVRFREQTYGHLARVVVSPNHRGLGLGRALCLALMREAPRLHAISAYSLYVFTDNPSAIALYRTLGFQERGFHAKYPTAMLMEAPLGVITHEMQ